MVPVPTYIYRATMLPREKQKLLDGDTYWMDVDLGLRQHSFWKVRLRNYSCVERDQSGGLKAQEVALELLYGATNIVIQTYKDRLSHDRWVADIWIGGEKEGLLGELLCTAGQATYTPM